jgi:hypothetical protein
MGLWRVVCAVLHACCGATHSAMKLFSEFCAERPIRNPRSIPMSLWRRR